MTPLIVDNLIIIITIIIIIITVRIILEFSQELHPCSVGKAGAGRVKGLDSERWSHHVATTAGVVLPCSFLGCCTAEGRHDVWLSGSSEACNHAWPLTKDISLSLAMICVCSLWSSKGKTVLTSNRFWGFAKLSVGLMGLLLPVGTEPNVTCEDRVGNHCFLCSPSVLLCAKENKSHALLKRFNYSVHSCNVLILWRGRFPFMWASDSLKCVRMVEVIFIKYI